MSEQQLRAPAQNWQEVDLHLRYVQSSQVRLEEKLDALLGLVPKMATTDYIDAKFKALADEYASTVRVDGLENEISGLKKLVDERSVQSTIDRLGTLALKITAIFALLAAAVNFIHPFLI